MNTINSRMAQLLFDFYPYFPLLPRFNSDVSPHIRIPMRISPSLCLSDIDRVIDELGFWRDIWWDGFSEEIIWSQLILE